MAVIRRSRDNKSESNNLVFYIVISFGCVITALLITLVYAVTSAGTNNPGNGAVHNVAASLQKDILAVEEAAKPFALRGIEKAEHLLDTVKLGDHDTNAVQQEEKPLNTEPVTMDEVLSFLDHFLVELHRKFIGHKKTEFDGVWKIFHDFALEVLYPWDREYLQRMPKRRNDGSVFLSLASYRDENCLNTLTWAYEKSKNPYLLNVGLVQQNCVEDCIGGILDKTGRTEKVPPDDDCYKLFCESDIGKEHCAAGRVRNLFINEDESLGPYMARYFASKLWNGEEWYMQIDAHMTFLQDWDAVSIEMLEKAPAEKPVMSHYPPFDTIDLEQSAKRHSISRLCGSTFADSDLENQIIRLGGTAAGSYTDAPRFAPYVAAGYFVAHSSFLSEVPFDPFLPWIFMGEEIIMSARLWTSGYDIFSPRTSVVGHIYFRRKKPKFWESVHRLFHYGVHNPLQMLVLNRVKTQLNYPESAKDFIAPRTLLTHVDEYSMGTERSLDDYLAMAGLDMKKKQILGKQIDWCYSGGVPPGKEEYAHLYNNAVQ